MDRLTLTIAGAGIGGLAAASALAMRGHSVRVVEQAPAITEVGAGIQISPNGHAVIDALGLGDALTNVSIRAQAVRLIDGLSGREVLKMDLARHMPDLRWSLVHRSDLISFLLDAARANGADVVVGQTIAPPLDGSALDGDDLLIGADGVKSAVRRAISDSSTQFFTHQVAWRAVIADDDATPEIRVFMGPGRHLVSYPLIGGRRNIVAVEERNDWAEEGWSHKDDPANLRAAFQGFAGPVGDWLARIDDVHLWGLFRHPVVMAWWNARQVLLGDAAHPTLPFLAQGANLALEDAWVLAQALEETPLETALSMYQRARRDRAEQVVEAASKNARNYHLRFGPLRFAAHTALRVAGRIMPRRVLGQYDWIYRHDVTR